MKSRRSTRSPFTNFCLPTKIVFRSVADFAFAAGNTLTNYSFCFRGSAVVIDDRVKLRCSCTRLFREKASRVRDGAQLNCPDCGKLLTLTKETLDPFMRRALKGGQRNPARQKWIGKPPRFTKAGHLRRAAKRNSPRRPCV